MPKYLPTGLTQYVFNKLSKTPRRTTSLKTTFRLPSNGWRWSRSLVISLYGGKVASSRCLNKTHWAGLSEPSWEREMDLHLSRSHILRYWAGTPDQHRQTNRLYRRMRIGAAHLEPSRNNEERFQAPGYACVPRAD